MAERGTAARDVGVERAVGSPQGEVDARPAGARRGELSTRDLEATT